MTDVAAPPIALGAALEGSHNASYPQQSPIATRFLRWLYDDQAGYIEIVAGQTNPTKPDKIDLVMSTRRWPYYDPARPDLIAAAATYVEQLAADYGNVYVGVRLYTKEARDKNERSEGRTKPSRVIFVDDAPAAPALPYSAVVRTSEGKRHAYYKCDRPATKDDNRRATAALGGDPSGVDLTQLVRVPGTFNTKNGGRWPVAVEPGASTIYTLDELRAVYPAVAPKASAEIADLDWPEVERHISNIDALLSSARFKLIKPDTQTGRILGGELLSFASNKFNRMDDSRSMNACAVAHGLLLRGFPDDEISAVLYHLYCAWGKLTEKGTAWIKLDIGRCLAHAHTKHPGVKQSPTRYRKPAAAEPIAEVLPISRARSDRPQRFTPAALFARYRAEPALCDLKRKARAAALQISTATLDRLEAGLRTMGLIEVETDARRQGSRVILLGGVINIPAIEVLSPPPIEAVAEAPIERTGSEQSTIGGPQCIGETHPPPETLLPPTRSIVGGELRGWVTEAFDAYPGRASLRKVRKHVEMLAEGRSFSLDALVRLYGQERDRRQRERQIAKLPTMKFGKLKVLSRRIERILAEGKEGPDGACYGWACWLHPYVEAEFDRRMEAKERLRTGQRRGATVDQALLLAEIEQQRRATAAPKRPPRGACVSPTQVETVVQPGLFADTPPVPGTPASLFASIRRIQSPPLSG